MMVKPMSISIRSYTKKQLISMYSVSKNTFHAWLVRNPRLKKLSGAHRIYTPKEVELIFQELGEPEKEN